MIQFGGWVITLHNFSAAIQAKGSCNLLTMKIHLNVL